MKSKTQLPKIGTKLNLELIYNLAWAMAKTADNSIPDPLMWLDGFDTFPLDTIAPDLMELLEHTLQSNTPKNG